jgi:hypothetical protein
MKDNYLHRFGNKLQSKPNLRPFVDIPSINYHTPIFFSRNCQGFLYWKDDIYILYGSFFSSRFAQTFDSLAKNTRGPLLLVQYDRETRQFSQAWSPFGGTENRLARDISISNDGTKLYVSNTVTGRALYTFPTGNQRPYNICRLFRDTLNFDPTFSAFISGTWVNKTVELPTEKVLVAGRLGQINNTGSTDNVIVRLNTDGSRDTEFNSALPTSVVEISDFHVFSDGTIAVTSEQTSLYIISADGSAIISTFSANFSINGMSSDPLDQDGFFLHGFFTTIDGNPANKMVYYHKDTGFDFSISYGSLNSSFFNTKPYVTEKNIYTFNEFGVVVVDRETKTVKRMPINFPISLFYSSGSSPAGRAQSIGSLVDGSLVLNLESRAPMLAHYDYSNSINTSTRPFELSGSYLHVLDEKVS